MKYWSRTAIMERLPLPQRQEVFALQFSYDTYQMCRHIACGLPASTAMTLMFTEGIGLRRVCMRHPTGAEWASLERDGFFALGDDFVYIRDAQH